MALVHPGIALGPARATSGDASGLLALLQEDDVGLRAHALESLHGVVDVFWAEVAPMSNRPYGAAKCCTTSDHRRAFHEY